MVVFGYHIISNVRPVMVTSFIHSIKSSLNSQLGVNITMDKLRVLIRNETVSNITEYQPAVDENSQNILLKGLYNYIGREMVTWCLI